MDYKRLKPILAECSSLSNRALRLYDASGFMIASCGEDQSESFLYTEVNINGSEYRLGLSGKCEASEACLRLSARLIETASANGGGISAEELALKALFSRNADKSRIDSACAQLHINRYSPKCALLIETEAQGFDTVLSVAKQAISRRREDYIFSPAPMNILIIKSIKSRDEHQEHVMFAEALAGTLESEYSIQIRIGIGLVKSDAALLYDSLSEARAALGMESGPGIFNTKYYLNEFIFEKCDRQALRKLFESMAGSRIRKLMSGDIRTTVETLFANTLNIAESARQLGIHRNTLIYRIEKIEQDSGFDLRVFGDAVTLYTLFKLSLFLE